MDAETRISGILKQRYDEVNKERDNGKQKTPSYCMECNSWVQEPKKKRKKNKQQLQGQGKSGGSWERNSSMPFSPTKDHHMDIVGELKIDNNSELSSDFLNSLWSNVDDDDNNNNNFSQLDFTIMRMEL